MKKLVIKLNKPYFNTFILIIVVLFNGCKQKNQVLTSLKEIQIDFNTPKHNICTFSSFAFSEGDKEYIAYASSKNKTIYLVDIWKNKIEDSISLKSIDSIFDFNYYTPKFFIQNRDSIFILPDETKTVFLINKTGKIINRWEMNLNYPFNYVLSGFSTSPMYYNNNRIYIRLVPKIDPFRKKREYHNSLPDIAINIHQSTDFYKGVGGWPAKYFTESYCDNFPSRCFSNVNSNAIYSFCSEDSLYIYDNAVLIQKIYAKSDSINSFEKFNEDSLGNIAYSMRYQNTSPRYGMIYYDPYQKLYYRIAMRKTNYVNEDKTTIKQIFDQPWSIIILNKDLIKTGEVNFNPSRYARGPIYITKQGLLIPLRNSQANTSQNLSYRFELFKINL